MLSSDFAPPSRCDDFAFLLDHVLKVDSCAWLRGMPARDVREMMLDNADDLFRNVVQPLRQSGDLNGARFADGKVLAPTGFAQAYRKIVNAGLHACTIPEEEGGLGISPLLGQFIEEISAASNPALHMYYGFNASAAHSIRKFGAAWLADLVVPALVSGDWVATMALTEAQAGSDLAQVRTRAVPTADGHYRVTGDKIFISAGDHDLTANIIHVVLAREYDEAGNSKPGLAGLNVFVVPKSDLATGVANAVEVTGIEQKMGLHGNPTCALRFDGAVGYRLGSGDPGSAAGMAPLFAMMNHARLSTANGALGSAALAAEMTQAYALERRSGRVPHSLVGVGEADRIIDHPDVSRMILSVWSTVEGARAAIAWANFLGEEGRWHPDAATRDRSAAIARLLTPLLKAFVTDTAYQACDDCLQIHGGHGYVQATGIEQFTRDGRISRIYEGANGIQATDFVMRRLVADGGNPIDAIMQDIRHFLDSHGQDVHLAGVIAPLSYAFDQCEKALAAIQSYRSSAPDIVLQCSTAIVETVGLVLLGWRLAVSAVEARAASSSLQGHKLRLAQHWAVAHAVKAAGLRAMIDFAGVAAEAKADRRAHCESSR